MKRTNLTNSVFG